MTRTVAGVVLCVKEDAVDILLTPRRGGMLSDLNIIVKRRTKKRANSAHCRLFNVLGPPPVTTPERCSHATPGEPCNFLSSASWDVPAFNTMKSTAERFPAIHFGLEISRFNVRSIEGCKRKRPIGPK